MTLRHGLYALAAAEMGESLESVVNAAAVLL